MQNVLGFTNKREQTVGETVAVYIAELRRLAIHCDKTLKDRFVCGLKQEHIQKKLLVEPNLTLEKTIQTVVAMETGSRDTVELQGKRKHVGINKLSVKQKHGTYGKQKQKIPSRPVSVTQGKCYRCGGDHKANPCRHLNTKCRYCGNPGHLEKVCFKKQRDIGSGKIHYVDVKDDNAESGNDCSYLLHFDYSDVNKITVEPIIVKPNIAGVEIPMEVDTGAAVPIIPKETLDRYFTKYKLLYRDARLITYSGEEIHPVGKIKVTVELKIQKETLDLLVVNHEGPALMGEKLATTLKT